MNFNLYKAAKQNILIVAHRGVAGGNIPCNTLAAYEIALMQGADMLETDVSISADGVLMIFHPKMEPHHLGTNLRIPELTAAEISELRYVNFDDTPTQFGVLPFDDFLENFKGRCYINIDKFWDNPVEIQKAVKRHAMEEQIVVKASPSEKVLQVLEELAPDLAYMPIVKNTHPLHQELMKRKLNYVGAEVLFDTDESEVATTRFMEQMHRDGKLVWANAIIYNYKAQLSAGHSDDTSLTESMEKGWGWLADHGFDLIQTDWPLMAIEYLKKTNRYSR